MACPVCGGPLVGEGVKWIKGARILVKDDSAIMLTKNEAEVFDILWRSREKAYLHSAEQLADYVYRGDSDGGPDHAAVGVRIVIWRLRARIKKLGLTVMATSGRGGGYMMGAC